MLRLLRELRIAQPPSRGECVRSLSRYDLPPGTQLGGRTSQNACITVSACPPYHQAAFWVHDGRPSVVPSSCQRSLSAEQAELRRRAAGISDSGSTLLVAKSCASSACRRASAVPSPFDSFVAMAEIPFGPGGSHPLRRPDLDGCTDCEEAGRADASGVLAAIQIGAALHRPLSRI